MFEVIENVVLAPSLHRLVVRAPRIATARRPGQFVIVRADVGEERIPLTIGDADPAAGTITLFVQAIGASTQRIVATRPGEGLRDVAGLPDPVGEITRMTVRPNGLRVGRMRVPLGVIAIIYEARPNVTEVGS